MTEVSILENMIPCVSNHVKCLKQRSKECSFPDQKSLKDRNTIQDVVVIMNNAPIVAAGLERRTREIVRNAEALRNEPTEK